MSNEHEALKPCPFCGGEANVEVRHSKVSGVRDRYFPSCLDSDCAAFIVEPYSTWATKREAIAAWNTRATPSPSQTALAAIAEAIREADSAAIKCAQMRSSKHSEAPMTDTLERREAISDPITVDLDRRRTLLLAKLLPMLSLMAGGEAAEVEGYDAASLYDETMMALGIEDEDNPDTMAEVIVEMDGRSGHGILDRLTPSPRVDAPHLFGAFRTTESGGGKFTMTLKFRTMKAMHAADDEWHRLRKFIEGENGWSTTDIATTAANVTTTTGVASDTLEWREALPDAPNPEQETHQ